MSEEDAPHLIRETDVRCEFLCVWTICGIYGIAEQYVVFLFVTHQCFIVIHSTRSTTISSVSAEMTNHAFSKLLYYNYRSVTQQASYSVLFVLSRYTKADLSWILPILLQPETRPWRR